ncbi:hypothetical protein [Flavilitoribacter nigricans]|uniref:Uncharacterized protein n=1 Tax=Flavilitoribacter nigricans (strain ATCC 23147 / DSM 23189 / NBRC 102662 / NCIMB 1420 / SS-2) TaxID=1122177 RepID=A0A2D0N094_FLAN2|nr:hypothetical protein [Flavilitoribacter nigricans]PHN01133.1 hypothetical protein CRP01_38670 [Flavilitoribacter nigricans DSM 23189 = NBRC 102662]
METPSLIEIGKLILDYALHLDWTFIISFILLAYGAIQLKEKEGLKMQTRYLVALTGLIYGTVLAFLRDYSLQQIDVLFQSFVFALVFHKLFIDKVLKYIQEKISTKAGI